MTDAYLKSWLNRVERLEEEQRGVGSDKRDLYAEAKGKGYNVKALRRIVAGRRRKDEREVEAEIDRYKIALGLAVDLVRDEKLSLRDAAKRAGVSKSSVHRALAVPAVSHDPETGEVTTLGDDAGRLEFFRQRISEYSAHDASSGCWLWRGSISEDGYATIKYAQQPTRAHRAAWEVYCGPIPDGMLVCHRCDVRHCVNPEHLFLGTPQDNMNDMAAKGRQRGPTGEMHHKAKLTRAQAEAIRDDTRSLRKIASEYGISDTQVCHIKQGKYWKDEGEQPGTHSASEVAVPPGDGEAPDLRGSAGTPSPIIEAGGNAPAAGSDGGSASALASPRPVGEAEIADRSNDADDLTPPDFLRRTKVAA